MKFLHRLFDTGLIPTLEEQVSTAASVRMLEDERRKYRDIVQNVQSGQRLMVTWDDANRMLNNRKQENDQAEK